MADCMSPFTVKHNLTNESIAVPCNKCPACFARRVSHWSFRLLQEDKISISSHFITLTYADNAALRSPNGYLNLSKRHVQLFFKSLRKLHTSRGCSTGQTSIKYYAVGEYGGRTKRPHYHIILFNADIGKIQLAWPHGQIHYGTVSGASVGYTLKYLSKVSQIPQHRNDDRQKEFSLMSKGLGISYLNEKMIAWHRKDKINRMYCNLPGGKKISMPRYYKQKLYEDCERRAIGYFARQKMLLKLMKKEENPTYYRDLYEAQEQAFQSMYINHLKNEVL